MAAAAREGRRTQSARAALVSACHACVCSGRPRGRVARARTGDYSRPTMRIEVNGEARQIDPGTTVGALLEQLGLGTTLVAVERNHEIVPRAEHTQAEIRDGDRIEIVHFVGGG